MTLTPQAFALPVLCKRLWPLVTSGLVFELLWRVYNQVNFCFAVRKNVSAYPLADIERRTADV